MMRARQLLDIGSCYRRTALGKPATVATRGMLKVVLGAALVAQYGFSAPHPVEVGTRVTGTVTSTVRAIIKGM